MRRIVVLGSTGSIGTQTLDVARRFPDNLQIVGLAAHSNRRLLHQQAEEFAVSHTSLFEKDGAPGLDRLATLPEADLIVVAVAGVVG
ncbi:MAG: 1-deoxy-D-xylulose-5-phosphate reductoisomerase, partial [Armatimonadota bacterium]